MAGPIEPAPPDPYKVLQVDPEAEDEVVQAAYRRLAQKYHPDRATGPEARERMVAINAAWELIGEPSRRVAYDLARRQKRAERNDAGQPPPPARSSAGTSMGARDGAATQPGTPPRAAEPERGRPPAETGAPRPRNEPGQQGPTQTVPRDWMPGRSTRGSVYDAATMRAPEGFGAAGPPPGNPSGSVLNFGRFAGWSLGEVARADLEYLEWLDRMPIGRPYREEIDVILRRTGRRRTADEETPKHGLFRRR
jgi:hypothetical protein